MRRRRFLRSAPAIAAGATIAGCTSQDGSEGGVPAVVTRPRLNWRVASSFSRSLDTIYGAAEVLADRVETLSGGRFRIRVYPGGELVPALQVMDAVQSGTVQMGHTASYYYTGKNPAFAFDTCVPFGLTARQLTAWMLHGDGFELMRELFADFNIVNLLGGNTGVQMGGWFRRPIGSLQDLRGMKMRIPGVGGTVMDRLGVSVQLISGGEIYPALERGAIDATEWVGPYDDEKLGFHQIARHYYYPGWWEPGPGLTFYVNRDAWDGLPAEYREIVRAAAAEAHVGMLARYDALNPPALKRLLSGGVQLHRFPGDVMDAARDATRDIMSDLAASDGGYRRVFESYRTFKEDTYRWFATAEHAFSEYSYAPFA
jgi:TRAP-type mannitol/chloroaromatic compound transport system substrate-binding protein